MLKQLETPAAAEAARSIAVNYADHPEKLAEAFGRLLDVLADKGVLRNAEVAAILEDDFSAGFDNE